MAAGMGLDFDRMAHDVFTRLVGARLTASGGAARRSIRGMLLIVLAVLVATSSARGAAGNRGDKTGDVDTEHMFGFTEGSDIGEAGEKELETDSTGRFGKFGGSYNNIATTLEAKYSFSDYFRLSADATVAYYDIA